MDSMVAKFLEELGIDQEKAAQLEESVASAMNDGAQSETEAMVAAASSMGVELTPEAAERALANAAALDEDDLSTVAGGEGEFSCFGLHVDEYGHDKGCVIFLWHCYTASMHTETKDKTVHCWSDYSCEIVSK